MKEAQFYTKLENQALRCDLCPWHCFLTPGQPGICKVRSNVNGKLITHVFNKVAALGIDPIEKKPLYHFYPGKNILSIGEVGCNLQCSFCQNHNISQCSAFEFMGFHPATSAELVEKALKTPQNIGIAYTYNEPFTFYEFMLETAILAHKNGLKNVVVSNGYVNPAPLENILPFIEAFNIDLKAFSEEFYHRQTKGKLATVLETLKVIAKSQSHLEITNLIIPGLNDNETEFEKMVQWIAAELGNDVPLHLSRYFPKHNLHLPPTPVQTLEKLYDLAGKHLQYVYLGNVNDDKRSATHCPQCGETLITRDYYFTEVTGVDADKKCNNCGYVIDIVI